MHGEKTRQGRNGHKDRRRGRPRSALACLAVVLAAALGPVPAGAQTAAGAAPPPTGTFDGLLRAFDLKAEPTDAPAFVRQSRPATTDFIPVGRTRPDRPLKVLTPEEVQAQTDSLDKARTAQQRGAGLKPPPVPVRSQKGAATPRKSKLP